jgi:hypothetical protein
MRSIGYGWGCRGIFERQTQPITEPQMPAYAAIAFSAVAADAYPPRAPSMKWT